MASTESYLNFVLDQLSGLCDISSRRMMGEFVLYHQGKVIGGVYDDRLLLKETASVRDLAEGLARELPYEGAKEMILADIDDRERTCRMIERIADDLPAPRKKSKM